MHVGRHPTVVTSSLVAIFALMAAPGRADDGAGRGRELVPTGVPRDIDGRPTLAALDELGRATGFPLRLASAGRNAPGRSDRPAAVEGGNATFWETLDGLARAGRLEITPRLAIEGRRIELVAIPGNPAPATIHGAYRCSLIGLSQRRRIVYGDPTAEVPATALRKPTRLAGTGLPPTWEQSGIRLLLLAEPRPLIDVQLAGPPRVDEAIDDRGRSLVVAPPKLDYPSSYLGERYLFGMTINIPLDLADPPARSVRRLRGVVPVVTWVGQPEPLEADLGEPAGRSLRGSGVNLKVIAGQPAAPATAVVVELSPDEPTPPTRGLFESGPGRMFLDHAAQFEVLDAAGKRIEVTVSTAGLGRQGAWRVTLTPKPAAARVPPARLRYRGLSWSRTDVPFDFEEIPLP